MEENGKIYTAHCDDCLEDTNFTWNQTEIYMDNDQYQYYIECHNCGNLIEVNPEERQLEVSSYDYDENNEYGTVFIRDKNTGEVCPFTVYREEDGDWNWEATEYIFHLDVQEDCKKKLFQDNLEEEYAEEIHGLIYETLPDSWLTESKDNKELFSVTKDNVIYQFEKTKNGYKCILQVNNNNPHEVNINYTEEEFNDFFGGLKQTPIKVYNEKLEETRINRTLHKGDVFINPNDAVCTILDIDENRNVTFKLTNRRTDNEMEDTLPESGVNVMLADNNYRTLEEDDELYNGKEVLAEEEDIGYDYYGPKTMEKFEGPAYIRYYGGPGDVQIIVKAGNGHYVWKNQANGYEPYIFNTYEEALKIQQKVGGEIYSIDW